MSYDDHEYVILQSTVFYSVSGSTIICWSNKRKYRKNKCYQIQKLYNLSELNFKPCMYNLLLVCYNFEAIILLLHFHDCLQFNILCSTIQNKQFIHLLNFDLHLHLSPNPIYWGRLSATFSGYWLYHGGQFIRVKEIKLPEENQGHSA